MRFVGVKNLILSTYNSETILNWEWDFSSIINNWSRMTQDLINFYEENGSFSDFAWRVVVLILTRNAFNYVSSSKCNNKGRTLSNNEYCFILKDNFNLNSDVIFSVHTPVDQARSKVFIIDIGTTNIKPTNFNFIKMKGISSDVKSGADDLDHYSPFSYITENTYIENLKNVNDNDWCQWKLFMMSCINLYFA